MSVTNYLKAKLGLDSNDEAPSGLTELQNILAQREARLDLHAEYGRPHPNTTNELTVVFPYTLYTGDDEEYGAGAKEFIIPDDGLQDADAPLTKFIGKRHGIGPDEVDFDALASVEGTTVDAELTDDGDIEVGV